MYHPLPDFVVGGFFLSDEAAGGVLEKREEDDALCKKGKVRTSFHHN
jgi:hypothetical protein